MATDTLICPECGGIIGATETTDHGKPCTCFKDATYQSSTEGDTSVFGEVVQAAPKVCWKCGTDVSGKKRFRDSLGYWCAACHKADKVANKPTGVKCRDCGRYVSEGAIVEYQGARICGQCRAERKRIEKEKRRFGQVDVSAHHQHYEKKRLYVLFAIFALLLLMAILTHLDFLRRHL